MPADFLLTNIRNAPSAKGHSGVGDLFQEIQQDRTTRDESFGREFEREIQRSRDTRTQSPPQERRDTNPAPRESSHDAAATEDSKNTRSGNSLPPDKGGASGAEQSSTAENGKKVVGQLEGSAGSGTEKPVDGNDEQTRSIQVSDEQQTSVRETRFLENSQLSARQRQTLELLNTQLEQLQYDKAITGKPAELIQNLQADLASEGLRLEELAEGLEKLAETLSDDALSSDDVSPLISGDVSPLISGDGSGLISGDGSPGDHADSGGILESLQTKLSALLERLETPAKPEAEKTPEIPAQPAVLSRAIKSLKALDAALEKLVALEKGSASGKNHPGTTAETLMSAIAGAGKDNDIAGIAGKESSTDLSPLLASLPGEKSQAGQALINKEPGKPTATAAPWGMAPMKPENASTAPSALADKLTALVRGAGVSEKSDASSADASDKTGADGGKDGLKDIEFILKNSDKLSAKAKQSLGELSLGELAEQAKQLGKMPDGGIQQKLKEVVDQIKTALSESARTGASESSSDSSSSRSGSTTSQPVSAFFRSLEQANVAQQTQKTVMTMQNHMSKPGWAGEVGQRLMMMVGQKIQVAEIRLDPPDLGPMDVKVKMQQEQAHVVFNSQHAAVRDALEQALPRLRELFDQNGLSLGDVDVQDQTAQQQEGDEGQGQLAGRGDLEGESEIATSENVTVATSDRLVDYYA